VTSKLSRAQAQLRQLDDIRRRLDDLPVLYELAEETDGAEGEQALADADAERVRLRKDIGSLEVRTLLSGEYDPREALVTIRSEAGGVDAADFAEMLMRMYLRWAERHEYAVDVYDTSYAEEAGIKSATFAVHAPFGYGTLSVEQGTHRLVRISRSTTRAAGRPRSPGSRWSRWWSPPTTWRSTRRNCGWTSTARRVPADRA